MSFTPNGDLVIVSEDAEAVQSLMNLLKPFMMTNAPTGSGITVFPLNAADASQVAETVNEALGLTSFSFGQTSMLRVIPDARMNALLVSGSASDVEKVRQLLEVLDRDDIQSGALNSPWIIPVRYSSAADVADVIRDVYASQLVQGAGGPGGSRGFTVRGGSNRNRTGPRTGSQMRMMSIGVDERSNSLVVSCSESMYREITRLVEALDNAANDVDRTVKIVALQNSTPSAVQNALNGLLGITPVAQGQNRGGSNNRGGDFRPPNFGSRFQGGQPFRPDGPDRGRGNQRSENFDRNRGGGGAQFNRDAGGRGGGAFPRSGGGFRGSRR